MEKRAACGFTLVEMIIALALSMVVLIAIVTVSTNMIRMQFQDIRSGNVNNFTWIALDRMNRELENATHLESPGPGVADTSNVMSGCVNWSNRANPNGGAIDTVSPSPYSDVTAFYYCVCTGSEGNGCSQDSLYRYALVTPAGSPTCPYPVPGGFKCGDAPQGSATQDIVVYKSFFHLNYSVGDPFFTKSSPVSGVEMHYTVGKKPDTVDPQAKHFDISTMVGMNKSYNNGSD